MHVGDLDGSASSDRSTWAATVEVTVHDADHNLLNGVTVTGTWSIGGSSATCTTGDTGSCTVGQASLQQSVPSVTFTVTAVTMTGQAYDAGANHDVDGSSDGTTITITKR